MASPDTTVTVVPAPVEPVAQTAPRQWVSWAMRTVWELVALIPAVAVVAFVPGAAIAVALAAAGVMAWTAQLGPVTVGRRGTRNVARLRSLTVISVLACALGAIVDLGARSWVGPWTVTVAVCIGCLALERFAVLSQAHDDMVANRLIRAVDGIVIEADTLDPARQEMVMCALVQAGFAAVSGGGEAPARATDLRVTADEDEDE